MGCAIATDDVMPARNKRKNQIVPKNWPKGSFWKIRGSAKKPKSKEPPAAICWVAAIPKKATVTGMAIEPPKMTSAASLADKGANPEETTSSLGAGELA